MKKPDFGMHWIRRNWQMPLGFLLSMVARSKLCRSPQVLLAAWGYQPVFLEQVINSFLTIDKPSPLSLDKMPQKPNSIQTRTRYSTLFFNVPPIFSEFQKNLKTVQVFVKDPQSWQHNPSMSTLMIDGALWSSQIFQLNAKLYNYSPPQSD